MRFLGWGIGHLNPSEFPHEADALIPSQEDWEHEDRGHTPEPSSEVIEMEGGEGDDKDEDEDNQEAEDIQEDEDDNPSLGDNSDAGFETGDKPPEDEYLY